MSRPGPAAKRPSGWEGLCPVGIARPYSSREKRSPPRDPRGVPRETIPSTANKGRCRAGRVRLCPLPTFSGCFRYTGRVTAAKQHPSGRLRRCPTGSAYAERKARRFSAKQARRKSAALFLPAPSVLNRPCFCFELRARADSPRFRGSLPLWGEATCGRSCGARCAAMPRLGP